MSTVTQDEILTAIHVVAILRPVSSNWNTIDEHQWAEYHQQQEIFDQNCEDLCKRLRRADERDLFEVLFPLACSSRFGKIMGVPSSVAYGMPSFAAHILFYIKPLCFLSCQEAIRVVSMSSWDLSLEEVPWYLARHFGNDTMHQSLTAMETENFIKEERMKREAWHASHSHLRTFTEWKEIWKETPPGNAITNLDTIRYWLDIFVREQEGILKTWEPIWRRHRK